MSRLLPYHILSEYDADEIDDMREAPQSATHLPLLRFQAWNETTASRARNFMALFEKQIAAYNSMVSRRKEGELRGEERYCLEIFLLQEEKQKMIDLKAQIEAKDKAEREAADTRIKEAIAQAEKSHAEAQAQADAQARAEAARLEARARAVIIQTELSSQLMVQQQATTAGVQLQGADEEASYFGWGSPNRANNGNVNSEGFWKEKDDNDEDGDRLIHHIESMSTMNMQDGWGQVDLNSGTDMIR